MEDIEIGKVLKKRLIGTVVGEIKFTTNSISLKPQAEGTRTIDLLKLTGKTMSGITASSSIDQNKIDVSKWVNEDEAKIPAKSEIDAKPVDLNPFMGDTITNVGFYMSKVGRKPRATLSITVQHNPEKNRGRVKTIAFGMDVK